MHMPIDKELTTLLAKLISSIPTDIVLIAIITIMVFIVSFGVWKLLKVKMFGKSLLNVKNIIKNEPMLNFQTLYQNLPQLKAILIEFEEYTNDKGCNTQNCESIISEENVLKSIHIDDSMLEHFPGILTALGIAGTFIGILCVLVPLQEPGLLDSSALVDNLLRGAGVAFLTSIFGICFSLLFLMFERKTMGAFKERLHDFQMAINNKLTMVTAESLLVDIKDATEAMADDIATAVTNSITEALGSVKDFLENSIQQAGNSSQVIVEGVMDNIGGTLSKFNNLAGTVTDVTEKQAVLLDKFDASIQASCNFADKMEKILPDISRISDSFAASSKRLEELPDSLKALSKVQEEFIGVSKENIELMNSNWITERERLTSLLEELKTQFTAFENGIANGIQTSMSKFDDELSRAGTYVATWLDRLNEDVISFRDQIALFNETMQNSSSDLQATYQGYANSLLQNTKEIESSIAEASNSLKTSYNDLDTQLQNFPQKFEDVISGIDKVYKSTTEQMPAILESHLQRITSEMNKTTKSGFGKFFNRQ